MLTWIRKYVYTDLNSQNTRSQSQRKYAISFLGSGLYLPCLPLWKSLCHSWSRDSHNQGISPQRQGTQIKESWEPGFPKSPLRDLHSSQCHVRPRPHGVSTSFSRWKSALKAVLSKQTPCQKCLIRAEKFDSISVDRTCTRLLLILTWAPRVLYFQTRFVLLL